MHQTVVSSDVFTKAEKIGLKVTRHAISHEKAAREVCKVSLIDGQVPQG